MDEPSLRLREALDKFIKHVDDLIEEEDPAGNGFHREYRVSFDTSDIGNWTMSMHVPRSLRPTAEFTIPALKFKRERVSKCSSFFKRGVSFIKFVEYLIVCRLVRFVYEEQFCTSYAPFCFFFFTRSNTHLSWYQQTVKLLLLLTQICTLAKVIYGRNAIPV